MPQIKEHPVLKIKELTQAQMDTIAPDTTTLYFVTDAGLSVYVNS